MAVNLALLFVSAVFFLATSAVFYTTAWLLLTFLFRIRAAVPGRGIRATLFFALMAPPLVAGVLTVGGTFLRHSHEPDEIHRSLYCSDIARFLAVPDGKIPVGAGLMIQGAAWLLLLWGLLSGLRLLFATLSLERELRPFLKPPSPKLAAILDYIPEGGTRTNLPFFEAGIPPARSCLLGIRHVRCILSTELVSASSEEELTAIVLHERSHYHAGDVWRTLLVGLLNCVFFSVRPLFLLSRRWREETELACDAATAAATGDPLALASAILRVQKASVHTPPLPAVILGFAEETACSPGRRIERLLAYAEQAILPPGGPLPVSLRQWAVTAASILIGFALLLTPQALCTAHCSLEAVARTLH